MKILITGAFGFIGNSLARWLYLQGHEVYGIGRGRNIASCDLDFSRYHIGDISYESLLRLEVRPDIVLCCCGCSSVRESICDPVKSFINTEESLLSVLKFISRDSNNSHLVYFSSAAVLGECLGMTADHKHSISPISPYGRLKANCEAIVKTWVDYQGLSASILRIFSVYGPGIKRQLIWDACTKFTKSNHRSAKFDGDGNEIRDWIYIDDLSRAVELHICEKEKPLVANFNTGNVFRNSELLDILKKQLAVDLEIEFTSIFRKGDPRVLAIAPESSYILRYFKPTSLEVGIARYVEWYQSLS